MKQFFRFLMFITLTLLGMQICMAAGDDGHNRVYSTTDVDWHGVMQKKYGLLSRDGERITEAMFDKIGSFSPNGFAMIYANHRYGYVDTLGNSFLLTDVEEARPFDEFGLAAVRKKSKWGLINCKTEIVLKSIFDRIEKFQSNGLAIVKYEKKFGLIDTLGNVVLPVIYDRIENFDKTGYAYIKDGNKLGVVDKRGRAVVPAEYNDKKSAMAALSDVKPRLKKLSDVSVADNSSNNKTSAITNDAEKACKAEEQKREEARKRLQATPTLKNFIAANLGEWAEYLATQDLNLPSDEEISNYIESVVAKWQVKGEFEPTSKWKERVNETTRTAKINALADSVFSANSQKIEAVRSGYRKEYEALVDKYCEGIAKQFASQTLELKPYDADNETFLISTNDFGDFLLPVPLEEAPGFKQNWERWKNKATATFVPNGEDVTLKSVTIDKYTYDSDMNAVYAQVDVDYNFKPVDMSLLNRRLDMGDNLAMTADNTTGSPRQGVRTEKIKISAGNAPDTDVNIPEGKSVQGNTFAVVIANGKYDHASDVMHAENDGRIMARYLNRTLGIPEENIATLINASYGQMASALSTLQDIGDAYKGSDFNIMFYYVGHGLPDDEGKKSYILPVDIDPRHVSICMPLEKIYADLGNLGAKNVTVMVDACFSGSNHGEGMLVPQSRGVVLKAKKTTPVGNMVVLTAAEGNETAFPYEEKGHGLFTYWLLKKLQETSGNVTLGELSDYVIDNVKKTAVVVNRKPQTPTISTSPSLTEKWRSIQFGH